MWHGNMGVSNALFEVVFRGGQEHLLSNERLMYSVLISSVVLLIDGVSIEPATTCDPQDFWYVHMYFPGLLLFTLTLSTAEEREKHGMDGTSCLICGKFKKQKAHG